MDNAFEWKRVRLYEEVQENLESLEHFEDDLNLNIHNQRLVKNFIRVGKAISKNLKEKYGSAFAFPWTLNFNVKWGDFSLLRQ